MKYAGIEVTKVTTINQPVRVAIFLVSIGHPSSNPAHIKVLCNQASALRFGPATGRP